MQQSVEAFAFGLPIVKYSTHGIIWYTTAEQSDGLGAGDGEVAPATATAAMQIVNRAKLGMIDIAIALRFSVRAGSKRISEMNFQMDLIYFFYFLISDVDCY